MKKWTIPLISLIFIAIPNASCSRQLKTDEEKIIDYLRSNDEVGNKNYGVKGKGSDKDCYFLYLPDSNAFSCVFEGSVSTKSSANSPVFDVVSSVTFYWGAFKTGEFKCMMDCAYLTKDYSASVYYLPMGINDCPNINSLYLSVLEKNTFPTIFSDDINNVLSRSYKELQRAIKVCNEICKKIDSNFSLWSNEENSSATTSSSRTTQTRTSTPQQTTSKVAGVLRETAEKLPEINYIQLMVPQAYSYVSATRIIAGNVILVTDEWPGSITKKYNNELNYFKFAEGSNNVTVQVSVKGSNSTKPFTIPSPGYWYLDNGDVSESDTCGWVKSDYLCTYY